MIKLSASEFRIIGFRGSEKLISEYGYKCHQDNPNFLGEGYALPQSELHEWT